MIAFFPSCTNGIRRSSNSKTSSKGFQCCIVIWEISEKFQKRRACLSTEHLSESSFTVDENMNPTVAGNLQGNPQFKYTSIQINRSLRSFMHVDKHNVGPSRIIGGTVWTEWQAQSTALSHIQLRSGAEKRDKRHMYRHNATTNTKTAKEIKNLHVKISFAICSKHLLKSLISSSRLTSPVS